MASKASGIHLVSKTFPLSWECKSEETATTAWQLGLAYVIPLFRIVNQTSPP